MRIGKLNLKKLYLPLTAIIFLWIYPLKQFGQTPFLSPRLPDTAYFNPLASVWSVRAYGVSKYDHFLVYDNILNSAFVPDIKVGAGFGVSYKNFALDLALKLYSSDPSHRSENFSLVSSLYEGAHAAEFTFQVDDNYKINTYTTNDEQLSSLYRKDVRAFDVGLDYNYNFNYHKFSLNAAFLGTQIQKHSAGTPLGGIFFSYFDLRADSSIVSGLLTDPADSPAMLSEANLLSVGITAGYAYTLVLPYHFYITLSLNPKLALNTGETKTKGYQSIPIQPVPGILTRDAIGYAGNKFYAFISFIFDYNKVYLGSGEYLSYDPLKVKALVGYRFN